MKLINIILIQLINSNNDLEVNRLIAETKIIGETEVTPKFKYPYMASIQWRGQHICGGTMITSKLMVTAAHCSTRGNIKDFLVYLHRHDLTKTNEEENGSKFKVIDRKIHPNYNTMSNYFDIAIWTLEKNNINNFQNKNLLINNENDIVAINFKKRNKNINNKEYPILEDGKNLSLNTSTADFTAIGWGRTKSDGGISSVLNEVIVPLSKMDYCRQVMRDQGYELDPKVQVCAGPADGGKDTCQGDSGGPLLLKVGDNYSLVGVTSFGIGCALPKLPGIYTEIEGVNDWIKSFY